MSIVLLNIPELVNGQAGIHTWQSSPLYPTTSAQIQKEPENHLTQPLTYLTYQRHAVYSTPATVIQPMFKHQYQAPTISQDGPETTFSLTVHQNLPPCNVTQIHPLEPHRT